MGSNTNEHRQRPEDLRLARYAAFVDAVGHAPIVLFQIDCDGTIELSEGKGLELLGLKPGQVVGLSVFDLYADYPDILKDLRRALSGESFSTITVVEDLMFETSYSPMFDQQGRLSGTLGIGTNITERHKAETALRDTERRFRSFVENMRHIIFCHGEKGTGQHGYTFQQAYIAGADAEKMTGTIRNGVADIDGWYASIHPDDRAYYLETERRRKEEGLDYSIDFRIIHPTSGETRWMRENGWTVHDDRSDRTFFDSYILDITDQKRLEADLREAKEAAEQANSAKSRFMAKMSHELRTPLNAIIGFSQIIEGEAMGPVGNKTYQEYAEHIRTSGQLLLDLIDDLLDMTRIEEDQVVIRDETLVIADIFDEVVALVAILADAKHIRIENHASAAVSKLRADSRALRQMVLNLLSNAIKFTPDHGTVTLNADMTADGLSITVSDTGIGIAPQHQDQVLLPFQQVNDHPLTNAQKGTGLGLPIVKSLIELHGGELELQSRPGQGTTVCLKFPADRSVIEQPVGT